jgi:hypothetical protein
VVLDAGGPAWQCAEEVTVKLGSCLLKTMLFLVLLPVVFMLPPVGFAIFVFLVCVTYFLRNDH